MSSDFGIQLILNLIQISRKNKLQVSSIFYCDKQFLITLNVFILSGNIDLITKVFTRVNKTRVL